MRETNTWTDRLPRWLTAVDERLVLFFVLLAILAWGFGGSWEYPQLESSTALPRAPRTVVAADPALAGEALFYDYGCNACHSIEGARKIGPSLLGIFGATVELDDGSTVLIDDAYLAESILEPQAKRVAGYGEAAMPSYEGLASAADVAALVEYIKGLD